MNCQKKVKPLLINLYTLFFLILVADLYNYIHEKNIVESKQNELVLVNQGLRQKLQSFNNTLPGLNFTDLDKSLKTINDSIISQTNIIELISQKMNFSNYLSLLSEIYVPGTWLTEINVSLPNRKLELRGEALQAGLIYKLVDELNKNAAIFINAKYEIREVTENVSKNGITHQFYLVTQRVSNV